MKMKFEVIIESRPYPSMTQKDVHKDYVWWRTILENTLNESICGRHKKVKVKHNF